MLTTEPRSDSPTGLSDSIRQYSDSIPTVFRQSDSPTVVRQSFRQFRQPGLWDRSRTSLSGPCGMIQGMEYSTTQTPTSPTKAARPRSYVGPQAAADALLCRGHASRHATRLSTLSRSEDGADYIGDRAAGAHSDGSIRLRGLLRARRAALRSLRAEGQLEGRGVQRAMSGCAERR